MGKTDDGKNPDIMVKTLNSILTYAIVAMVSLCVGKVVRNNCAPYWDMLAVILSFGILSSIIVFMGLKKRSGQVKRDVKGFWTALAKYACLCVVICIASFIPYGVTGARIGIPFSLCVFFLAIYFKKPSLPVILLPFWFSFLATFLFMKLEAVFAQPIVSSPYLLFALFFLLGIKIFHFTNLKNIFEGILAKLPCFAPLFPVGMPFASRETLDERNASCIPEYTKWEVFWLNFIIGIGRSIGFFVGGTIIIALLVKGIFLLLDTELLPYSSQIKDFFANLINSRGQ